VYTLSSNVRIVASYGTDLDWQFTG
jgi:hypothetical protein